MSRMSSERARRLMLAKRQKQVQVVHATCTVCGHEVQGRTAPLATARMTDHYRVAHADLMAAGADVRLG